jgi:phage tail sheath protein FI
MAERLSAGIFIEEKPSGASTIAAVSTSTFATVGFTRIGKVGEALLVTSLDDFFTQFGGYTNDSLLPIEVTAFFNNGGSRAYIVREVPSDALIATVNLATNWKADAIGAGIDYNLYRVRLAGNDNSLDVITATFALFDLFVEVESELGKGDWSVLESFAGLDLVDPNSKAYILQVVNDDSNAVRLSALAGGIPTAFDSTAVTAESIGTGTGSQQTFTDVLVQVPIAKNTLKIKKNATIVGVDNGSGKITAVGGSGVSGVVDYDTGSVNVFFGTAPGLGDTVTTDYYKAGASEIVGQLIGGTDGSFPLGRSELTNPSLLQASRGMYALNKVEEMLNMGIAESAGDISMMSDIIAYAETRKDVFAILAPEAGMSPQEVVNFKRAQLGSMSNYAAMYYPWIMIADPLKDGRSKIIPPMGHVAGVYARTDSNRNVGKAPAGVADGALSFSIGLERVLTKGERDLVYPAYINPLISSSQTGRAVWGSRTLATTGDFQQINARRLFIFLEKSVFNSTHDFVFESIGTGLYSSIGGRISGFLNTLFLQGYFKGDSPSQAFFVKCDESNNPPSMQAALTVICDIGIAVNEPAEFIVFRFQRKLATAA